MNLYNQICATASVLIGGYAANAIEADSHGAIHIAIAGAALLWIAVLAVWVNKLARHEPELWDNIPDSHIAAMDETMTFIQHDGSRRVDTRKDPILLAPGSIERFKRPRNFRVGLVVGALLLVVVGWAVRGLS